MAEGSKDFIQILLETGIDGCWPKVTHLIAIIKNGNGEVIWQKKYKTSDSHEHTESQMLEDQEFKDKVKTGNVDIILTSNYSPCRKCADELIEFYEYAEGSIRKFTIRFSQLYKRCIEDNRDGLKNLNRAGITLEAMTEESWFDMVMQSMFNLKPDKVRKRDCITRNELDELLSEDTESESSDAVGEDVVGKFRDLSVESDSD